MEETESATMQNVSLCENEKDLDTKTIVKAKRGRKSTSNLVEINSLVTDSPEVIFLSTNTGRFFSNTFKIK